ncbi:MAG: hypothetical protein L3J39_17115 [Verrucomicrobiales bacterium]|nr:hypothetical protein [Verrucomicrobiales bacterium]
MTAIASSQKCKAALFRNGRSQAMRIPKALELDCSEVLIYQEGERLIVEPVHPKGNLLAQLQGLEDIAEPFPDIDRTLPPLDDVDL